MTGPDVSDWQTFLKIQGLYDGIVDGAFGPKSDGSTRNYQTRAGLAVDGVVGPRTLARAIQDGYKSTTGASLAGMDTRVNCARAAKNIAAAGMKFVARYYSHVTAKTLTPAEAQSVSNAGVEIVAIFQDLNNSADLFSSDAGALHAARALALASGIGQPAGTAIYFAVDFDPKAPQIQGPVLDYFKAVRKALSAAPIQYAVGVYGSGLTCRLIRDSGCAKFTWLTCSAGYQEYAAFRPHADIVQLAPERTILPAVPIDDNIAQSANFGSFRLGQRQAAANRA